MMTMMMMKAVLFFTVSLIKGHMGDTAVSVTGIAGGSVIFSFQYKDEVTKESVKSFCRVSDNKCTEAQSHLWLPDEKFTMTENKSVYFLSVLIRNLTVNDRGEYICKANNKPFKEVKLDVEQDPCCGSSEKQPAYILGTAVFHCKYPKGFHDSPKQLFKEQNGSLQSVFTYRGLFLPSETSDPRFSMNMDHDEEHMFTVTLTNVSRHDEGLYFCAAHATTQISYNLIFNEIQLHVTDSSFIITIVIITVSVCVIVLFAAALGFLFLKKKCKKTKVTSDERHTGEDDEIDSSPYYASVQDSGNTVVYRSTQKPKSLNTVYAMAHLPTSLSDSDFYTLAEEPRRNES